MKQQNKMAKKPSDAILIYGDCYLSKNILVASKKKYAAAHWVTLSASGSLDDIRMEVGVSTWDDSLKFVVIEDLPNQKAVREFLLDIAISCPEMTHVIIWDSTNAIKLDPKTHSPNKTWAEFIDKFRCLPNVKVVNNGIALTEKDNEDTTSFVQKRFEQHGKQIGFQEAKLLMGIVGCDRGLLASDIDKLSLTSPSPITSEFILHNAFPTSKEAILYKIGDALETGSYDLAIEIIEKFLNGGENPNRIAETILNQARWQLVTTYYWASGLSWNEIPTKLMGVGKFPSTVWQNSSLTATQKKVKAETYLAEDKLVNLITLELGIPHRYIKNKRAKGLKKLPKGASLPHPFIADKTVSFVRNKIINQNSSVCKDTEELKRKAFNRAIRIYLFMHEKLAEIRYGTNPEQDLQEMARAMTNFKVMNF